MNAPTIKLTDQQIEARLDMLERRIAATTDPKELPVLNRLFMTLINEQARRDEEKTAATS